MTYSLACRRMNVVGKPYEGKPHVRFDVAGDGDQVMVGILRHSQRKRGATDRPDLQLRRHSLTLHQTVRLVVQLFGTVMCQANRKRAGRSADRPTGDRLVIRPALTMQLSADFGEEQRQPTRPQACVE